MTEYLLVGGATVGVGHALAVWRGSETVPAPLLMIAIVGWPVVAVLAMIAVTSGRRL